MRIALLTSEYVTEANYDGGLANYVHRLARALSALGHEVTVIVISDRDEDREDQGVRLLRIRFTLPKWAAALDLFTLRRFSKLIYLLRNSWLLNRRLRALQRRDPFAVVQYSQLGGLSFFHPPGPPAVVRLSSYTPIWRKKGGYDGESALRIWQQERLERWAMSRADAIFSPSRLMAAAVSSALGRPVRVIENPFFQETASWDDRIYREQLTGKTYLLFFGRLNVLKGTAVIAEILAPLLEGHADLFFVFAGSDPGKYRGATMSEHLKRMAGAEGGRVLCLGKMAHEALYPVIQGALAVVLPSLVDNLPNTCLEAMGLRKVVVGTSGASFDQLIRDGENGLLCRPGDPGHLLQTLEKVLSMTPAAREEMGRRAKERIAELKPERMIPLLTAWYQEVIAAKAGRGR
jgi:glycosyltransferase involved in cell wall biosynthesis